MSWNVIIPSCDDRKVLDCVDSLIETHPGVEPDQVVIVSDGLSLRTHWRLRGVRWVRGRKPFVFSRAINMGVAAADPLGDIVILGDDARFETEDAIDRLRVRGYAHHAAAIAPEVVGLCGQAAQRAGSGALWADWLAFICVYIPRAAWADVGPLDERFVGYGYDDVDWCRRAAAKGYRLRVTHDVTVRHLEHASYRSEPGWESLYAENRERFLEKWGQA